MSLNASRIGGAELPDLTGAEGGMTELLPHLEEKLDLVAAELRTGNLLRVLEDSAASLAERDAWELAENAALGRCAGTAANEWALDFWASRRSGL